MAQVKHLKPGQLAEQFNDFIQPDCTLLAVNDVDIDEQVKFKMYRHSDPSTYPAFFEHRKVDGLANAAAGKPILRLRSSITGRAAVRGNGQEDRTWQRRPTTTQVPSEEVSRLRNENAKLVEQLAAKQAQLDEGTRTAVGLRKAMELLKMSRAEVQAKDSEIANLKARLQQFEGEPPERELDV